MWIHPEVAQYQIDLTPRYLQLPIAAGFAEEVDAEVGAEDGVRLRLVAEAGGRSPARLSLACSGRGTSETADHPRAWEKHVCLATAAAIQRRGVGSRLVEAAEAWGRSVGATIAETWTYHGSPLSVPFWEERMGYQEPCVNLRKPL